MGRIRGFLSGRERVNGVRSSGPTPRDSRRRRAAINGRFRSLLDHRIPVGETPAPDDGEIGTRLGETYGCFVLTYRQDVRGFVGRVGGHRDVVEPDPVEAPQSFLRPALAALRHPEPR